MKPIKLNDVLHIKEEDFKNWTICLNNAKQGSDVYSFSDNKERLIEHISWKRNKHKEGEKIPKSFRKINTPYCLQFLRLDNTSKENWLFLGAYELDKTNPVKTFEDNHQIYNLHQLPLCDNMIERLVIEYKKIPGPKQAVIDVNNLNTINVVEILDRPYINIAKQFDGYENIKLSFDELRKIINANVDSWRVSLSNIFGIYVIADTKTNKLYVGSAYGEGGIWQRWSAYVNSNGTGGNKGLDELIKQDPNYAYNFQFSILEVITNKKLSDDYVIERENHWKEILLTRSEQGLNRN